ncbi:hypothetical protein [Methanosarcina vacuolata]|uniref:GTPases-Sulfate adenylate transferase subunit 1 n=1 Tax=Methanosarcina vacuolata Z-761 TaxID=1434123 RepID=A0A0E3Q932_9EURY|nr:hypothetical protein [Methanosarcina vacuolata]AKB45267.1 hypothetical protein MSVAZ_2998 [Methanosarcina vacuolata Z-761]
MIRNKIGTRVLLLAVFLAAVALVPAVNAQNENDYSVTEEVAFEHANAQIIDFIANDAEFEEWKGAAIDPKPLELYDPNGQKLYHQFSVYKNNSLIGRVDVGANKTLGQSIQVIEQTPVLYNITEAVNKSIETARNEYPDGEIKSTEVVVYCYPSIGAMTVIKDKASGDEHRIFVDAYTLEVIPDRHATETEPGIWSIFDRRLQNGVEENLKSWQASDQLTKSIEQEAASKGICISVPVTLNDYLNSEATNVNYEYYNYFFGLYSLGNTVISRYGKLPVLENEEQKENWNSTLEELSNRIEDPVASKYMYPHGEVMSCGINDRGYFVILFKYGNVDEPLMNEMYTLIDDSAKEMGIQDVPVEFGYGTYWEEIYLEGINGWYWFGKSTENLSKSDINTLEEVMEHKPTMPLNKTIAAYGIIPLLKDPNEINLWQEKLYTITCQIQKKMTPYMEKGQIITYGARIRLEIEINENLSSEEQNTVVKEVYQIIDEEARKQNITDVPVVFITPEEESMTEPDNSSNNSDSESDVGGKQSKNNSTPGFGLLASLTCLYGGWKLKRK